MSNEELLEKLYYAYEDMRDYVNSSGWVKWSQEAEDKATERFIKLKEEVLNRMNK